MSEWGHHLRACKLYGWNGTRVRELSMDEITRALTTLDFSSTQTNVGNHFFMAGYQDLANGNVLDFTWLMPDTTKWIHWTWEIDTEKETLWQVYENAVATNPLANTITPLNSNRNSGNPSGTTLKYEVQTNLAGANADTAIGSATLLESGISGAGQKAGDANRINKLILKQDTLYCLRATANAAGYINFNMNWYEHTNEEA